MSKLSSGERYMNMSSIFLVDKRKNAYSFKKLPEAIYIDTCFWIELMGKGKSGYSNDCKQFFMDCIDNQTMITSSNIVLEEIEYVTKNAFLRQQMNLQSNSSKIVKMGDGKIHFKKTYNNIVLPNKELLDQLRNMINTNKQFVEENSILLDYTSDKNFRDKIDKINTSSKYTLVGKDSEHFAVFHNYGINSIATVDGDFWNSENLNIFTIPREEYKILSLDRANVFLEYDENKF